MTPRGPGFGADLAAGDTKDDLDAKLHDLANAVAAARSFAEVAQMRLKAGSAIDPPLVESLVRDLDRTAELVRDIRRTTHCAGDALQCRACGYTFVNRKAFSRRTRCRRCRSPEVDRWKPAES